MLAIVLGCLFIVFGLWGMVRWLPDVMVIVRGMTPAMFCCGGLLAVVAGIASIRDDMEARALKKDQQATPPAQK
jgi:thiol:disulfide interchange protein